MHRKKTITLLFLLGILVGGCNTKQPATPPNVILIMADDMGYETLGCYGGRSYPTPVIDSLARQGIQFNHCVSQPLCTPSRVKIMTGLYNYRNYGFFGHLDDAEHTFGNLFKENGYATCIAGKWQLNGLAYPDSIPNWEDASRPVHFGFDSYCLWQLTLPRSKGERYSHPLIEQNGQILPTDKDDYGPDIFCQFVLDFIERNQENPFFVYYPMVLVHDPFVPTPDSKAWQDETQRTQHDTTYFKDMVRYTDKIVGRIVQKLSDLNLENNTLLIFTGDNGTHPSIYSNTSMGRIQGGKGNTTDAGTHVPLVVYWGNKIEQPFVYEGLVEFSDFYPTFADLLGKAVQADGKSFWDVIAHGKKEDFRNTALVYYDPRWGKNVNRYRGCFARTKDYKLYQDGRFFYIAQDRLEQVDLSDSVLSRSQQEIRDALEEELKKHPKLDRN